MERRRNLQLTRAHEPSKPKDVSEVGVNVVNKARAVDEGLDALSVEKVPFKAADHLLDKDKERSSVDARKAAIEKQMIEFGATEAQVQEVFNAIDEMQGDTDKDEIRGEANGMEWIVTRHPKSGYDIRLIKKESDSIMDQIDRAARAARLVRDMVTDDDVSDFWSGDEEAQADETLQEEEVRAETLEEIRDHRIENADGDTVHEQNPVQKPQNVLSASPPGRQNLPKAA